ncbi:DNA phosphorothioation-dependent restriction protein DptG [Pedobacter psychrodurus]|uniref:DNA phosphorothioation-dependent restriction protein DptG n=1 Tax=Pedobacter psychrodurus TaxID=2530456 RepID=A0A4V2MR95_9SPHI|nr:DNA phosphorothioation-dependent restriction protein DptG [Pedobacter psychrodurus]TCD28637.1 DNA phosphorothioation-dependent restriction protein DptG [Pedobacter psychrodurus]
MRFRLNKDLLVKNMFNGDKLSHSPGNSIRLFPFVANRKDIKLVTDDLKDFRGIAGACFRECLQLNQSNIFDKTTFINDVCEKANAKDNPDLKELIEKMAFNEKGQLVLFDTQIYPYVRNGNVNKTLNDIAKFIIAIYFDEDDRASLKKLTDSDPENLFYKLILSCIKKPEPGINNLEPYYQASSDLRKQFKNDLHTLISDKDLFVDQFHQLIKFYFFKYTSELALRLNMFFGEEPAPLYFSVKWEKLQGARASLKFGWDLFEANISPLFSHVIVLELINYIDGFAEQPVAYREIKEIVLHLDAQEQDNLMVCIDEVIELYRFGKQDVNWDNFRETIPSAEQNPILAKIRLLYQMIEYQFEESSRGRAKLAYQEWLWEFTKINFTKPRGKWGNSLALGQEYVLLLTRLCVGSNEKIRLKDLWAGFQARGVLLDSISRDHIIQYFDKINLLEKKSDSGDAQYIRKFSQTLA